MIQVTRLNNKKYYVNCDLIEIIESTPDTVITLTNGKKFVVKESCEEVVNKVVKFKRRIHRPEREV
ncbi:flagellar FlbD family protein [Anaerobranca gottschalkii]|uniref:Flagellar protein FlbD n=1 Tax=Anaerobranca gottschalkii DSM 13577 TaxID=1120990 RepID=A0A1H9ZF71_9FIRM|nr:flagellar FlbD family protein [Anaerobranca gottschalkii]SES79484.1 flagellar protein FlbD [Anaerobranca gottschalkii DSM 13577]